MLDESTGKFYWGEDIVQLTESENLVLGLLIWRKGKVTSAKYINKVCFNEIEARPPYLKTHNTITSLRNKLGRYIKIKNMLMKGYYV